MHCFISLTITCVAAWVSFGDLFENLDELPRLLAALIGVVCSFWFVVETPWLLKLSLIIALLLWGNLYLKRLLHLGSRQ
ncbi:MAG: hypothetical protein ACFBSC_18400 [Microcoleaceae cyanobacterium]